MPSKKEDEKMFSEMLKRGHESKQDLQERLALGFYKSKQKDKWRPIIKKLANEKKISVDRHSKLNRYLVDDKFDKIERYIKKKFPDYMPEESESESESESSSEDEEPKRRSRFTRGRGFPFNDDSSSSSSSSEESSSSSEEEKPKHIPFVKKKKFSKKIEKEIIDYLKKF